MAPSMAANINPQGTAATVGRATPLAFFLAAVAVLLIAYVFVRLCQYYRHAGSVYVFTGATLGPHAGAVAGLGLMGTYVFYALVTSSAAGIFGASFLDIIGVWNDQPDWAGFLVGFIALALALFLAVVPAQARRPRCCSAPRAHGRADPGRRAPSSSSGCSPTTLPTTPTFTMKVFSVEPGTSTSDVVPRHRLRPALVRGVRGRLDPRRGDADPQRDIPRAILWTAIFGGVYFTVVTAIEMMGFTPTAAGVEAFIGSPALVGDLGRRTSAPGWATSSRWVPASRPSPAAWRAWSVPRGCCSRSPVTSRPATRSGAPAPNATPAAAAAVVVRHRVRDRRDLRGVLRRRSRSTRSSGAARSAR